MTALRRKENAVLGHKILQNSLCAVYSIDYEIRKIEAPNGTPTEIGQKREITMT